MKKLIALVSVVFAITNMSAQLKVHSNGNISIKTTETPNATLAIGGVGLPTQSFYVKSKNVPLRVEGMVLRQRVGLGPMESTLQILQQIPE